jgi:hypothetical protein
MQGKTPKQIEHSEKFAAIGFILVILTLLIVMLSSCNSPKHTQQVNSLDDKSFVIIDGQQIELVADDDDNQYLKQWIGGPQKWLYIPFPYATSDASDSLQHYQAKR